MICIPVNVGVIARGKLTTAAAYRPNVKNI